MQGTTDVHHDIADALLPEADPVFDNATALHATVHVLDPQPTLVQCLVGSVLLQRQLLAAGFLGRHKDLEGVSELWICYPLTEEETHQYGVRGAMITQVLHCPYCHETDIVRHGKSPGGKQRYRCWQCLEEDGRTFLLEYAYAGQSPAIKQQIVDMAMNASGIRDTARVLHISPTTVIKELKKKNLSSST
jgi:transposase-like protein